MLKWFRDLWARRPVSFKAHEKSKAFAVACERGEWEARLRAEQGRFRADLEERTKAVASIIEKASRIRWDGYAGDRYQITLAFDPRMFGHSRLDQYELDILARQFGRRVEDEIRTAKFVEAAAENRYRRFHDDVPLRPST